MIARLRAMEQAFEKVSAPPPPSDVDPEVRPGSRRWATSAPFVATRQRPPHRPGRTRKTRSASSTCSARRATWRRPRDPSRRSPRSCGGCWRADPEVIDGWFSLGNAYFKERRYKEAIEYFRKALSLKPDYDLAVINIAAAYRQLGDDDAALAGFEHYLTIDPKDAYVRYQMGEIWLDRGDLDRAEKLFREALQMDDHVAPAKNALGGDRVQARRPRRRPARLAREALELRSDVRLAHYNLALIAETRGDLATAEREYLEELDLHPETYKAAFNLSRVYAQMGEKQLEIDALRQALDGNPKFADGHFFLARALLASGGDVAEAARLAREGLELAPDVRNGAARPLRARGRL